MVRPRRKPPVEETYYDRLGVAPGATYIEIHAHYRALARASHIKGYFAPEFERVTEAWSVVKDSVRRKAYDAVLSADGGNCEKCEGRGLQWSRRKDNTACAACGGTGREWRTMNEEMQQKEKQSAEKPYDRSTHIHTHICTNDKHKCENRSPLDVRAWFHDREDCEFNRCENCFVCKRTHGISRRIYLEVYE